MTQSVPFFVLHNFVDLPLPNATLHKRGESATEKITSFLFLSNALAFMSN